MLCVVGVAKSGNTKESHCGAENVGREMVQFLAMPDRKGPKSRRSTVVKREPGHWGGPRVEANPGLRTCDETLQSPGIPDQTTMSSAAASTAA